MHNSIVSQCNEKITDFDILQNAYLHCIRNLNIDVALKLYTKKELENLNKQWKRSLIMTKLTMKECR